MVGERRMAVLRAIVQDYVQTSEPVGSKALLERHQLGVSAATVRNDMAALEDEGLISAPHTSAGRIPTDAGYRLLRARITGTALPPPAEADIEPDELLALIGALAGRGRVSDGSEPSQRRP